MRASRSRTAAVRQKSSGGVTVHDPRTEETHTVTVTCATNGPRIQRTDGLRNCAVLADVEAFCAKLRRLGAGDDYPVRDIAGLRAVVDVSKRR